jgi:hypothetical protein
MNIYSKFKTHTRSPSWIPFNSSRHPSRGCGKQIGDVDKSFIMHLRNEPWVAIGSSVVKRPHQPSYSNVALISYWCSDNQWGLERFSKWLMHGSQHDGSPWSSPTGVEPRDKPWYIDQLGDGMWPLRLQMELSSRVNDHGTRLRCGDACCVARNRSADEPLHGQC